MRRYALPVFSGVLLALALAPFYIWPLALVALVPFFYFAAQQSLSGKQLFWGGWLAGALAVAPTLYISLLQLEMQPGAPLLTYAVRTSSLFFLVGIGILFAAVALVYKKYRTGRSLADSLFAAGLYTLVELLLFVIFDGYYYASLAHALTPFPPALLVASLGGTPLLIFVAVWVNAVIAQRSWRLAVGALAVLSAACGGAYAYGTLYKSTDTALSVALLQRAPESLPYIIARAPEPFDDAPLRALIVEASQHTTLVVYPFAPVEATYEGGRPFVAGLTNLVPDGVLGQWLSTFTPATTTVMLWGTLAQDGNLYDEFEFWNNGNKQSYQKHILHPLSDYTPQWLQSFGLARVPYSITAGSANTVSVAGTSVGGLACSELQQPGYSRRQAAGSGILFSVGFDAFFPGAFAAQWSLEAARLRAAENGTPVVRSTIFGPSAFIKADGSVEAELGYGKAGILQGSLQVEKIPTLYAHTGSWPTYIGIVLLVLYFLVVRVKRDSYSS